MKRKLADSFIPQMIMKSFLLMNVKVPSVGGILTFKSRNNCILGLSEPEKNLNFLIFFSLCAIYFV